MAEYRLFEGDVPHVSTAEFHADRERAPHLEQPFHQERLHRAAMFVRLVTDRQPVKDRTVSDLGCGDGGLLSLLSGPGDISAWGYDFCPASEAGWTERDVNGTSLDVFGADWDRVAVGRVVVMTEVLEHLADPHGTLRRVRERGAHWLVCSSPWNERPGGHSAEHAWAWDFEGYSAMIREAGWEVDRHEQAGLFQVVLAKA
jgi:hypothetical protein